MIGANIQPDIRILLHIFLKKRDKCIIIYRIHTCYRQDLDILNRFQMLNPQWYRWLWNIQMLCSGRNTSISDIEIAAIKKMDTTSISDAMDKLGTPCGVFGIQAVVTGNKICGEAFTVHYIPRGVEKARFLLRQNPEETFRISFFRISEFKMRAIFLIIRRLQ